MYRRRECAVCKRPDSVCYCKFVKRLQADTEVVIWQHPSEVGHAKGTAMLLNLCLPNSRIYCGETASATALGLQPEYCALLYPKEPYSPATHPPMPYPKTSYATAGQVESSADVGRDSAVKGCGKPVKDRPIQQLLILDGTWRKSRKMLHVNPWLLQLHRLALNNGPGRYSIRKSENGVQLSTFEAGIHALKHLEAEFDVNAAMVVFQAFIQQYERFLPDKTVSR